MEVYPSFSKVGIPGGSDGKNPLAMWDLGLNPWLGRSSGGRHDKPLQYS